jgi:hypothetical protein
VPHLMQITFAIVMARWYRGCRLEASTEFAAK